VHSLQRNAAGKYENARMISDRDERVFSSFQQFECSTDVLSPDAVRLSQFGNKTKRELHQNHWPSY
jgi:hypothetical protein